MAPTILQSPFVVELLLPFLLVFVVIYAILQKTKILGDGKKQIDAIVALVIGLIAVAFGYATGIIINLIPILAVTVVVLLVFMLMYGMTFPEGKFEMNRWLRGGIGIIVGIVVIISVLVLTGAWDSLIDYYNQSDGSAVAANVGFIIVAIAAIAIVVFAGGDKKKKKEESE